MRVLVCGGRKYDNYAKVFKALHDVCIKNDENVIIQGEAKGADALAKQFAINFGIKLEGYPANWLKHGKSAGIIRNRQMLEEGKPDLVIAFPGGKGTANMVQIAKDAGTPVQEIE